VTPIGAEPKRWGVRFDSALSDEPPLNIVDYLGGISTTPIPCARVAVSMTISVATK
jgi:hypothetical protein